MGDILTAVRARLIGDEAVAALIAARMYPRILPQRVDYPAISFFRVSHPRDHSHDGASGLAEARIQIDCWDTTEAGSSALATAVRDALDGYKGTSDDVRITGSFLDNERDDDDVDGKTAVYRVIADYRIQHQE